MKVGCSQGQMLSSASHVPVQSCPSAVGVCAGKCDAVQSSALKHKCSQVQVQSRASAVKCSRVEVQSSASPVQCNEAQSSPSAIQSGAMQCSQV